MQTMSRQHDLEQLAAAIADRLGEDWLEVNGFELVDDPEKAYVYAEGDDYVIVLDGDVLAALRNVGGNSAMAYITGTGPLEWHPLGSSPN